MWLLYAVSAAALLSAASAAICVPLVECKNLLEGDPVVNPLGSDQMCKLADGSDGVLCSSGASIGNRFKDPPRRPAQSGIFFPGQTDVSTAVNEVIIKPLKSRFRDQQKLSINFGSAQTNQVVQEAKRKLAEVDRAVQGIANRISVPRRSPEALQLAFGRPQTSLANTEARKSLQDVQVLTDLKKQNALGTRPFSVESPLFGVDLQNRASFPAIPVAGTERIPGCEIPPNPDCTGADKFRRNNGECNNRSKPRLGKSVTAFSRFFPAEYEDGIWEPRKSQQNSELPSARLVSERVVDTTPRDDNLRSLTVMQLGQFINHDMISTPTFTNDGGGISCCTGGGLAFPESPLHPTACNPIRVPADDPFYSQFGRTCMNQVRSLPAPFEDCIAGPTSQLNQVSQYLDLSNIYGSSDEQNQELRSGVGGRIKSTDGNLLPQRGGRFFSGEGRLNENPGLTFMHTIWTREHNRVADELARLNPQWDDERLYQEARRITNGEYQHIIYNEYVPTVLGFRYTRRHGLNPSFGLGFSYSESNDPSITSEFSTAALRFGHSQVQDEWILRSETNRIIQTLKMEDVFFRGDLLEQPGFMAQMARSLTRQKNRIVDNTFSPSVHEKLFAQGRPQGLDLISLNIQRGRDHGLPTYVTVLENCLEREIQGNWDGLAEFFEPAVLKKLRSTYESIFDIDLYIGGVTERRKPGALVGEVFQCLIGEQFFSIRYGDRFFYDNGNQPNSFTFRQVRELQQASWARILCDNIEGLDSLQPLAMWQPSVFFNRPRSCSSLGIPRVDINEFGDGFRFQG